MTRATQLADFARVLPNSVPTIADLSALSVGQLTDGQRVVVDEYTTGSILGGGPFFWNPSSTASPDGGAVIAPAIGSGRWLRQFNGGVTPEDFGAPADGVSNDRDAFFAAGAYLNSRGGGTIVCLGKYLIDNSWGVQEGVTIKGVHKGFRRTGSLDYNNLASQIIINPATTLTLGINNSATGCVFIRKGLDLPFSNIASAQAGVAAFSGTAITIISHDNQVTRNLFLGFNRAVDGTASSRTWIELNAGDCTNGVRLAGAVDTSHVARNHFWPFTTVNFGGSDPEIITRTGTAYDIIDVNDWTRVTNNFCYGYNRGYRAHNVESVNFLDNGADHNPGSVAATTAKGYDISGTSQNILLLGNHHAAVGRGIHFNTTPTSRNAHRVVGHSGWTTTTAFAEVESGSVAFDGCAHAGGSTGSVFILHDGTSGSITGGEYRELATGVSTPTGWNWRAAWNVSGVSVAAGNGARPSHLGIANSELRPTVGGTANAITLQTGGSGTPFAGQEVRFRALSSNTGGVTIAIDGGVAIECRTMTGVGLRADYIRSDIDTVAVYDGSYWQVRFAAQYGTGSNGRWARYENGVQECWHTMASSGAGAVTWTFERAFIDIHTCKGTAATSANSRNVTIGALELTSAPVNAWDESGTRQAVNVHLEAKGKWF